MTHTLVCYRRKVGWGLPTWGGCCRCGWVKEWFFVRSAVAVNYRAHLMGRLNGR